MAHRFELHMHTSEVSPCSHISARESVPALHAAGYDGLVITDHVHGWSFRRKYGPESLNRTEDLTEELWNEFIDYILTGFKTAEEVGKELGMTILLGMEIHPETSPNDYLLFGDSERFLRANPYIFLKTPIELGELAKNAGMFIAQAHPYRGECEPVDEAYMDGIEVFNANPRHFHHANNDKGFPYAKEHGLIPLVGTDYHNENDEGLTCVDFWDDVCTSEQLVRALRARRFDCLLYPTCAK